MSNKIFEEIERTALAIRAKDNTYSFNEVALAKFELIYFLTMDLVRYELMITKYLSDLTREAISQLFTFQCFEFFYRDSPEIFEKNNRPIFFTLRIQSKTKEP